MFDSFFMLLCQNEVLSPIQLHHKWLYIDFMMLFILSLKKGFLLTGKCKMHHLVRSLDDSGLTSKAADVLLPLASPLGFDSFCYFCSHPVLSLCQHVQV